MAIELSLPGTGEHFRMVSSARTGDGVFRFRWTLAPGKRGPPPHMHPHETETFAVVSGTLRVWVDGAPRDVTAGEVVAVPPRVPHRFLNPGPDPVVVDVSLDGALQEDTLVPLAVLQSGGGRVSGPAMLANVVAQFANEAIGAHPPAAQTVMRAVARALVALGVRPRAPVVGWDERSAA